jgi:[ribosomal protein S5]-alanine N-acetyltransferase
VSRALVEGSTVFLRLLRARDRDEFLERARASRTLHGRWVNAPSDPEAFAAYLKRARSTETETLVVCRHEDGAMVGVYNVGQIFYGHLRGAYLGYYAFTPFSGQGYMREGVRLTLRYAFGPLKLHRLEANIQPDNEPSLALVRGAGFRLEGYSPRYLKIAGRWRDHERWAILAEDLHPGQRRRT